jgi:hypothetical protein
MAVRIKKPSRWEYVRWVSVSVAAGAAASGGAVTLKSPQGKEVEFWYFGLGAGLSTPKLPLPKPPKLPKLPKPFEKGTAILGPDPFPSDGWLGITTDFEGDELAESDIRGLCCFAEIGAGAGVGLSGTGMLLNLDPKRLPLLLGAVSHPILPEYFFNSADAVLYMGGVNIGLQWGGGMSGLMGYLV